MTVEDPRCQESDSLVNRMIYQITVVMKKFVLTSLLVLGGALYVPAQSRQENLLAEDDAVSAGKEDLKDDRGTVLFSNRLPYRYEVNIGWAGYPGSSALSDCFSDLFYDRYVNSTCALSKKPRSSFPIFGAFHYLDDSYSTVTLLAKLRGLSTSLPRIKAV